MSDCDPSRGFVKIGFGGGCHWCTEAVFQSLRGIIDVQQGFIKSQPPHDSFSEAVMVTFDTQVIPLSVLIDVHLRTHASTSHHKMRGKYRSAIYTLTLETATETRKVLEQAQSEFAETLVTMVLPHEGFKPSQEQFKNYYRSKSDRPFCKTYIDPKLAKIRQEFGAYFAVTNQSDDV